MDILGQPTIRQTTKVILPLFESYGKKLHSTIDGETDFRWERERRHVGNFNFKQEDVAFGLCPESEIDTMEQSVKNAFPFIDPDWTISEIKSNFLKKGLVFLSDAI